MNQLDNCEVILVAFTAVYVKKKKRLSMDFNDRPNPDVPRVDWIEDESQKSSGIEAVTAMV